MRAQNQLKRLRQERGWSAKKLAEILDVSEKSVVWWQYGVVRPHRKNAARLEAVLQTPLHVIYEQESAPANDEGAKAAIPTKESEPLCQL
jgi:transcriptional regulator with XRE-family HTH domain